MRKNKSLNQPDNPRNQPGRWGKVYGGKDLWNRWIFNLEWKSEGVV